MICWKRSLRTLSLRVCTWDSVEPESEHNFVLCVVGGWKCKKTPFSVPQQVQRFFFTRQCARALQPPKRPHLDCPCEGYDTFFPKEVR